MNRNTRSSAFSLLEIVVAIGVFALGIIVVIGLFAPLARSVGSNAEAEAASNVADLLKSQLAARVRAAGSFAPATRLFKSGDAWNPTIRRVTADDPQVLFADRTGTTLESYDALIWGGRENERFYEIELMRNPTLSPAENDDVAVMLAYTARIRWPVLRDETLAHQQSLFVNGSIRR